MLQIQEARDENKHELLISGQDLNKILSSSNGVLDSSIFSLVQLNFLRLAGSTLSDIPDEIGNLINLTSLELQSNCLTSLPHTIGKLNKLKLLDVSENKLEKFPEEMNKLSSLTTITSRNNLLTDIISFESSSHLAVIDIRMNKLKSFENLCHDNLKSVTELLLAGNEIDEIPDEIKIFANLKNFNVSENAIKEIPSEILECSKLKEINLKGNPLTDRRFRKLVESDRGFSKTVLDYMKQHLTNNKKKSDSGKNKKGSGKSQDEEEIDDLCDRLDVLSANQDLFIKVSKEVKDIRGHLVCCIFRNLDLNGSKLKTFLSIQTKLHESICEKRMAATIATHDVRKLSGPLQYCAKAPGEIAIHPLNKPSKVSAREFYRNLKMEAEALRKQMKRNSASGLHKYLSLVEGLEKWPILVDSKGTVISFPPITNAHDTRIDSETTDVLVEITSGTSQKKCKEVMEALILATLNVELLKEKSVNGKKIMKLEQVRVVDETGTLIIVYPSRTDLVFDDKVKVGITRP